MRRVQRHRPPDNPARDEVEVVQPKPNVNLGKHPCFENICFENIETKIGGEIEEREVKHTVLCFPLSFDCVAIVLFVCITFNQCTSATAQRKRGAAARFLRGSSQVRSPLDPSRKRGAAAQFSRGSSPARCALDPSRKRGAAARFSRGRSPARSALDP